VTRKRDILIFILVIGIFVFLMLQIHQERADLAKTVKEYFMIEEKWT
jgi:preprotein translocase subunit YajC